MSYWLWSNLSQYSDAELEEHKIIIRKVIELRKKMMYGSGAWEQYPYNTILDLENQIIKIDEELERRKPSRLLLQDGSFFLLEDGSHLQLEGLTTDAPALDTAKESTREKEELHQKIEALTKEKDGWERRTHELEDIIFPKRNNKSDDEWEIGNVE